MLTEISKYSIEKKQTILEKTFNNRKGEIEQIDDVLVMGIKMN